MQRGRPMGVLYTFRSVKERTKALFRRAVYKHIGVGFGVARSTGKGQCDSLKVWDERQGLPRFFVSMPTQFPHFFPRPLGAGRTIANTMHVGQLIEQELKQQQRSQAWLARAIFCTPTNVRKILSRPYIDTDMLCRISKALNHNFFDDLAKSMNQ